MKNLFRVSFLAALLAAVSLLMLSSCASGKKAHPLGFISKANNYHLDPNYDLETDDAMIDFEYEHRTHGAIESEDYQKIYGHYVTVFWRGVEKGSTVALRLDYRQSRSGAAVTSKEITPQKLRWRNTTDFEVTGDEYADNGPITSWRVVLLVNGEEADVYESFLWK